MLFNHYIIGEKNFTKLWGFNCIPPKSAKCKPNGLRKKGYATFVNISIKILHNSSTNCDDSHVFANFYHCTILSYISKMAKNYFLKRKTDPVHVFLVFSLMYVSNN